MTKKQYLSKFKEARKNGYEYDWNTIKEMKLTKEDELIQIFIQTAKQSSHGIYFEDFIFAYNLLKNLEYNNKLEKMLNEPSKN